MEEGVITVGLLPLGLCADKACDIPHVHRSETLGVFWCTADQTQREPYRSESRRASR